MPEDVLQESNDHSGVNKREVIKKFLDWLHEIDTMKVRIF